MNAQSSRQNYSKSGKRVNIIQTYSTEQQKSNATNEEIKDKEFEIILNLKRIMKRKNMSIKKLATRIDYYFLLELLCVILQEQGLWSENLCNNGFSCNISRILRKIGYNF